MRRFFLSLSFLFLLLPPLPAQAVVLEYQGRYQSQAGEPDHLVSVALLPGGKALVGGNRGIALVDPASLPKGGTRTYLYRLKGVNGRNYYPTPDGKHFFVNLHSSSASVPYGFAVCRVTGNALQKAATRYESGVFYEKMCLQGNYLFVAAHSSGIRIFDVSNPESPLLVGRLDKGFTDAFAVAVDGNRAYVADGAGGLKIVDVTNKKAPLLLGGETLATAEGTSEDVAVKGGRVYVAAGGAGVAVYDGGKPSTRKLYPVEGAAESLSWAGNYLAVGSLSGVTLFLPGQGTELLRAGWERAHRRGPNAALRFTEDTAASGSLLLLADWNYLDVFQVKPMSSASQPDIDCDTQRIRFFPSGGKRAVTVRNNGAGTLKITSVQVTSPAFSTNFKGADLAPGAAAAFEVSYKGGSTSGGSGVLRLYSNDPDENPLPIQVFGNTTYPDPGDRVPDFTVSTLVRDPLTGKLKNGSFTLSKHKGQVVWLSVFGTW